jgi:mono/diheme cytochrome c family protein
MKRWGLTLLGLVVVAVLAVAAFLFVPHRLEAVSVPADMPKGQALLARGEYLARAADCVACHTAPGGKPYAGGLPFKLPFGTLYAPNITPDGDTGIGQWSDAEFVRAMHHGVGKAGEDLYPAFPYASYALTSDADALAIKAYLFSLAPVRAETPANTLSFPYNQRYIMRFWKLLFVPGHADQPDPTQPADVNRGRYLVEALGHCGECHTPRNQLYALDNNKKFAGAVTEGWNAYNITSDKEAGIGAWSDDQIAQYLSNGHADRRGSASGNMAEAVSFSLRYLSAEDIRAIVAYLRRVPPQNTGSEPPVTLDPPLVKASTAYTPAPDESRQGSLGLTLFQGACASCHAWNGEGQQTSHAALIGSQTVNDPKGTNLMQAILRGVRLETAEGASNMPAFGQAYSDIEVAALSNYVIDHFGGQHGQVTPADVAKARQF